MDNRRHLEPFGPDLSRGPFSSNSAGVSAVQIATALAQLRAPVSRADDQILEHADFIRQLADKLFPDEAEAIRMSVSAEESEQITTSIIVNTGRATLLDCWLADYSNGGETDSPPDTVWWLNGTVIETVTDLVHYRVLVPTNGVATALVSVSGARTYRWAASRNGRVFYSSTLFFED